MLRIIKGESNMFSILENLIFLSSGIRDLIEDQTHAEFKDQPEAGELDQIRKTIIKTIDLVKIKDCEFDSLIEYIEDLKKENDKLRFEDCGLRTEVRRLSNRLNEKPFWEAK